MQAFHYNTCFLKTSKPLLKNIVLHQRSNITSFVEHLKFQEQMCFIHIFWVKSGKPLMKQVKSGHYTFRKCYIQGDQRKYFKED